MNGWDFYIWWWEWQEKNNKEKRFIFEGERGRERRDFMIITMAVDFLDLAPNPTDIQKNIQKISLINNQFLHHKNEFFPS